jgi:SSS family transporter
MTFTWVFVIAYVAVQLFVGYWASKRIHNEKDFLIAGRSFGTGLIGFSLFATWFGAETIMGSSAAVAEQGLAGSRADPFGYTICLLLIALLLAYQLRARAFVTVGDFYRQRYGRGVEIVAIVVMIPTSIIWGSAQLLALGQVITVMTDVNLEAALIVATIVVVAYTMMGGMFSDVWMDVIQSVIIVVGLSILLTFVFQVAGGIGPAFDKIRPEQLTFVAPDETFLARMDTWMVAVLGTVVSQEAMARLLATRTPSIARRAAFLAAGIYFVIGLIPVLIGLIGNHLGLTLETRDQFLPELAAQILPPVLLVLFMGALVAAILSTVDGTFLTVSSLLEHNIVSPLAPNLKDMQRVWVARMIVAVSGTIAYFIATGGENIYALVQLSSSFGTAGVLITVLFGLWLGIGGPITGFCTLLVGASITSFLGDWLQLEAPFITAVLASAVTFLVLGVIEKRLRPPQPRPA